MSIPTKTSNRSSNPSEEGEGDDGTKDREASSVEFDSSYEQVLPWVTSGKALSTTGKDSLDTDNSKLSSSMSYGEGLTDSPAATVDKTSSKDGILPAESRRLGEYLPRPQHIKTNKGRTRADEKRLIAYVTLVLMTSEEMKIARRVEDEAILEESLMNGGSRGCHFRLRCPSERSRI